jgi:general secretion pathway protein J
MNMRTKKRAKKSGFTLIELLVAISVLAIVAVLGWRGLDSIVRARVALNGDLEQTRGMQLAFAQMQSDCSHIARGTDIGGRPTLAADPGRLTLVRTVFSDNQPSRVQVVAYRLADGVLTRRESIATRDLSELDSAWTAAIADTDTTQAVALQSGVSDMAIRSWSTEAMNWRSGADSATKTVVTGAPIPSAQGNPANPQTPAAVVTPSSVETVTGIEVALRLRDRSANMVKIFLLGAA